MHLVVVNGHPERTILAKQVAAEYQVGHALEITKRMLKPVVVVLECAAGVVRRVNEDALDLAGELLFKGFEREEVVAKDETVIE